MKKYCLIMNPTAKSGKGKKLWSKLFCSLDKNTIKYDKLISKHTGHAIDLTKEACLKQAYDVVVAVGGDGTINEVLNGMREAHIQKANLPELGILYTGTSPDVCKYHGIDVTPEIAVINLIKNSGKSIDIGEVTYLKNEKNTTSWFLCSVNLGIGASIAKGSNSGLRKYLGDFIGTLLSILLSTFKFKNIDLECIVDGKKTNFLNTLNLTIGKNPFIASGIKVNVNISPDDGKMYLFAVNNFNLFSLLTNLKNIYNGTFYKHKNNTLSTISSFKCTKSSGAKDVEFDGDPQGSLPCNVKIIKDVIRLIK